MVAAPDGDIDVERAALLVAAHGRPGLDVDAELARLDVLADICGDPSLEGLHQHLFTDLGFDGNHDAYYEPENSFLDRVLDRRRGIPLTLSMLTVFVGRRLGLDLAVVAMPGHVLVGDRATPDMFVDPFNRGTVLDGTGAERLFRALHGDHLAFQLAFLAPSANGAVLVRLLANLEQIYRAGRDRSSLAWVLRLRSMLPGAGAGDHVQLASALAAAGRFDEAADELDDLADSAPAGEPVQDLRTDATRLRARLN